MSYYGDASLVLIPSGYKNGKVYSQKPTDGAGDLTFTRASNATRVASNGLIEKVRTNLLTYSNTFTDASWVKTSATITANDAVSPDGTTNASKYEGTNATNAATKTTTLANGLYTFSIFVKRIATDNFRMNFSDGSTGEIRYVFNLSNQTSTTTKSGGSISDFSTTYVAYPNGWYRLSIAARTNAGTTIVSYFEADNEVGSFYVYGAQLEVGDIATDYIATTTTAVSVGPVSGLPRLDYLNSTCPRLLLEPQRSNVITFSENFDNAGWTKTNATITANAGVSPDGYTNADRLIPSNAAQGILQQNHNITAGQSNTLSVFAKASGLNDNFVLNSRDNASASNFAQIAFNLSTGTIATAATASGSYSAASGTITPYGNGWYRLTLTHTSSISTTTRFRYFNETASGDGTNGYLVYGAQAELNASYATSYVNTLSTSVTRVADAASKTGISSLIGQTEGTVFLDLEISAIASRALFSIDIGTTTNYIAATTSATNQVRVFVSQAGSGTVIITSSALTFGRHKLAIGYKSGDYVLYIDGVQAGASASTLYPVGALIQFVLNNASYGSLSDGYNQALLFKTRLSNSDLATLTQL